MLGSYGSIWEAGVVNIILFVLYCSAIVSIIYFTQQKGNIYYKQLLIVSICLFFIAAFGSLFIPMNTIVAYVLISVYAEEYLKIHASSALAHRQSSNNYIGRDLIFFALLMGLGFSFIEHIAYLIHHISTQGQTMRGMHIAR
jgi:RsiW-degrading membrane proteinase PrsW (M82 family)